LGLTMVEQFKRQVHEKFLYSRFTIFEQFFGNKNGKLLDLGGADGSFLGIFKDQLSNFDVYIADIDDRNLQKAQEFGWKTVKLRETPPLEFDDLEWDVVFCNSVIEHYTGPKEKVVTLRNGKDFRRQALQYQKTLSAEIMRIGKYYFVQTPHKLFPIESHTMFPLVGYLRRSLQLKAIEFLNSFWIKKTQPDWNLLSEKQMRQFFPDAVIQVERFMGFPKSIIAMKY
jgi:hypothetical protein